MAVYDKKLSKGVERTRPLPSGIDPAPANNTPNLVVSPLSAVNYGVSEFKGDRRHIEAVRADVMSQYERLGAKGQGSNFPLFTESYLNQTTRSGIPPELVQWIQTSCQMFLERQAPSAIVNVTPQTIFPLWANVHRAGEYHAPHHHGLGQFVLSGVFFVNAPSDMKRDTDGLLVLERSSLPGVEDRFDLVYGPGETIKIRPVPGWMVLFPPFVRHYVTPHLSAQPRISIAFNVCNPAIIGPKAV